jgi:hypothetical protein
MRHDFGFVRQHQRRLQGRATARRRLARMKQERFSRRLAYAALVFVAFPGRALVAMVTGS